MFEKSLSDLVKGIRASKRDTGLYISSCIAEIKTELNSTDTYTKANALQKMTFLQMMGYNMSWASFATVEVMSAPRFAHKRIGYLAACQAFHQDTEVVLLTTNLLKKELRGAINNGVGGYGVSSPSAGFSGIYEAGLAINCVSNIVTEDLAKELLPELKTLTSHPSPYIRKKAIMCLFKLFVKYPQGLRLTFDEIRKSLDDQEPAVVSCAVNVITELSDKNPKNYVHLAPAFFNLLTSSNNNWMLIKVVKLLGSLVSEEPRLARKLLEPLANMVKTIQAKSLLYESVYTITLALPYCRRSDGSMPPNVPAIVDLCAQTLQMFVQEEDQNLKYMGLIGFHSLTLSHPKILSSGGSHRDLILRCLSDEDVTIRTRALELLTGMATRKNLKELIGQLLHHVDLAEGSYKADLVGKIVFMCSMEKYALIPDFQWYLATLIRLAHVRGIEKDHGQLLKAQIMDVALRVLPVRTFAVEKMARILLDQKRRRTDAKEEFIIANVLPAAAWIVGEYANLIWDATGANNVTWELNSEGPYHAVISALLHPRSVLQLLPETQAVYIQSAVKVFAAACSQKKATSNELEACVTMLRESLPIFEESSHIEVQERAFSLNQMLTFMGIYEYHEYPKSNIIPNDSDDGTNQNDLLTLKAPNKSTSLPSNSNPTGTVAERCHHVAATLNYLLTPDPMKPISAKAQKKKRLSPSSSLTIDLDAPIDTSAFASIMRHEKRYRQSGTSLAEVDFTAQRRVVESSSSAPIHPNISNSTSTGPTHTPTDPFGATNSMEHINNNNTGQIQQLSQPTTLERHHDPFYLNSGADPNSNPAQTSKFGMIQLVSDDENGDVDISQKKKNLKKAEKKKKKKLAKSNQASTADLEFLSKETVLNEKTTTNLSVLESDDEDDDNDFNIFPSHKKVQTRKTGSGKEFSGLAKVDLTFPLREDEVMPVNTHRQVPERRKIFPESGNETKQKKMKEKKAKKGKKEKKNKKNQPNTTTVNQAPVAQTGDLLDFGSLLTTDVSANTPTQELGVVNSAFDDLLNLEQPPLEPPPATNTSLMAPSMEQPLEISSPNVIGKRPWIKATIKKSSAKGNPSIPWEFLSLDIRVFQSKSKKRTAASIMIRLNNQSSIGFDNVVVEIEGDEKHIVNLGAISASKSTVSSTKTGPFMYDEESSLDIRGKIKINGGRVPIKITLPASMVLNPVSNLTQDDVMSELASGNWETGSAKIEATLVPAEQMIPLLSGFLRADEISGNKMDVGTLAAKSKTGAQVRVLVKVQKGIGGKLCIAKLDVKCTDKTLGMALVSDLKRIIV